MSVNLAKDKERVQEEDPNVGSTVAMQEGRHKYLVQTCVRECE